MKTVLKTVWNFVAKFFIGLTVNLLAILSSVLNVYEFGRNMLKKVIENLPDSLAVITVILGIIANLAFLVEIPEQGLLSVILYSVLFWVILLLFLRFSHTIGTILCYILSGILEFISFEKLIDAMRNGIYSLVNAYFKRCGESLERIERYFVFAACWVIYWLRVALEWLQKIIRIIVYPLFVLGFGFMIFSAFFMVSEPPVIWSAEWWIAILLIPAFGVGGGFLAFLFNEVIEESIEDSAFGLFDIFKEYWEVFRNFSDDPRDYAKRKSTYYRREYQQHAYWQQQQQAQNQHWQQQRQQQPPRPQPQPPQNAYWATLSACTTFDELKRTYRNLAKEVHPDVSKLPPEEASNKMKQLNEAFDHFKSKFQ